MRVFTSVAATHISRAGPTTRANVPPPLAFRGPVPWTSTFRGLNHNTFVWPALHSDGRAPANETHRAIPMGARLRLRYDVSLDRLGRAARVIATAMKVYGIQFGNSTLSGWQTDGSPDARWNDTDLRTLRLLKAADFDWVWPPFLWPPPAKTCSVDKSCSSHAVYAQTTVTGCQCVCRNFWAGADCSVCPFGYSGTDCDVCPAGTIRPTCKVCSVSTDCSGHATAVEPNRLATACQCTCLNQWQGKDCASCNTTLYSGSTCDRCAPGRNNYPMCMLEGAVVNTTLEMAKCAVKCTAAGCTNQTITKIASDYLCSCAGCAPQVIKRVCSNTTKTICVYPLYKCQMMRGQNMCVVSIAGKTTWVTCGDC